MKKREYRSLPGLELRQESGEALRIRGYAALFNVLSEPLFFGRERILPGAFTASLKNDVRALVGHDPNLILGRTKSKTLNLKEDEKGLYVEIQPPDTTLGHDVVESIRRGDLDQMSFGFQVVTDQWKTENKEEIRELMEVDLFDVSVVAFPAYQQTSVSIRSLWPDGIPEEIEQRIQPEGQNPPSGGSNVMPGVRHIIVSSPNPGQRFQLPPEPPPPAKPSWARQRVEELEKKFGLNQKA